MSTATQPRRGTRYGRVQPISSDLLHLVPTDLHESNLELAAAITQRDEATRERDEAQRALTLAEREDRAAAEQALNDGKALPKPKVPVAQTSLVAAERKLEAACTISRDRVQRFLGILLDHHSEVVSAVDTELAQVSRAIEGHLSAVEQIVRESQALSKLRTELGDDATGLQGRRVNFNPTLRPRVAGRLPEPLRDAFAAMRKAAL